MWRLAVWLLSLASCNFETKCWPFSIFFLLFFSVGGGGVYLVNDFCVKLKTGEEKQKHAHWNDGIEGN